MSTIQVGPVTLDLKLYAGDGFSLGFNFVDKETAEPWPAAGAWAAQVRAPITAAEPLLMFTVDLAQQSAGIISISLTGDQVRELLDVDDAVWDLEQLNAGAARTWYRGRISATPDVTR